MSDRSRSTIREPREMASEVPKSLELETRVSRLEILVNDLRNAMDLLNKRTNAIQAQLDHLDGRIGRV